MSLIFHITYSLCWLLCCLCICPIVRPFYQEEFTTKQKQEYFLFIYILFPFFMKEDFGEKKSQTGKIMQPKKKYIYYETQSSHTSHNTKLKWTWEEWWFTGACGSAQKDMCLWPVRICSDYRRLTLKPLRLLPIKLVLGGLWIGYLTLVKSCIIIRCWNGLLAGSWPHPDISRTIDSEAKCEWPRAWGKYFVMAECSMVLNVADRTGLDLSPAPTTSLPLTSRMDGGVTSTLHTNKLRILPICKVQYFFTPLPKNCFCLIFILFDFGHNQGCKYRKWNMKNHYM